jgi:hypothetical protein
MFSCFDDDKAFLILCDERGGVNDARVIEGKAASLKQMCLPGEKTVFVQERTFKTVLQEGV